MTVGHRGGSFRLCFVVNRNLSKFSVDVLLFLSLPLHFGCECAMDTYGLYNTSMWTNSYGCKIDRNGLSGNYTYSVATDWANRPVNYVSWGDAARFANWLNNGQPTGAQDLTTTEDGAYSLNGATRTAPLLAVSREANWKWAIASEDEWYKAAYYNPAISSYYDYATSSDTAPGYVDNSGNLSNGGSLFAEGGTDPGNYATQDGDLGVDGIGGPYYRSLVGEWENSGSPYGTFDQGGNIMEWNEGLRYGTCRILRGGSFADSPKYQRASHRDYNTPPVEGSAIGFRVVQIPEPATLSLLALGGLALLRRRR